MIIKRTEEFDLAYRFVTETNQNIFLTGKAGTGKTTFLKYLQKNSIKKIVVTAPTGVAAINARGVTLHSLFQLPFGIILPASDNNDLSFKSHPLLSKTRYNKEKLNLLRRMELLIIDEASMLASYILDAIDTILRSVRRNHSQPFGGVQILFIGDLYQLPPVVKREDWEILQNVYSSIFFFDSIILRNNIPVIIEFKEIFRQKDNKFIEILNGIRNNNITEENFRILNSRLKNNFMPQDIDGYIILTTHNYQSDEINKRKLINLPARTYTFIAETAGEFPEDIFPAEKELNLKCGAQVMFLKNDAEGKQYFNGKIGTITKLGMDSIKVKCRDDPFEIEVKKYEWQNIKYTMNAATREITEEVLGSYIQYPLRLAWAITIHKSQGLTFDRIIVDAEKAFATGQVYVALSRCTSLEGLSLISPVDRNFLGAHSDLRKWECKTQETNIQLLFDKSRQNFILQELQNIFTWENWQYELKDLNDFLMENSILSLPSAIGSGPILSTRRANQISPEAIAWIKGLMEKQKELYEIAEKFKHEIIRISKGNMYLEKNDFLQKRIKDGANYFCDELSKWEQRIFNHPLSVKTKKLARKIDKSLEELAFILKETLYKINYIKNGFMLNEYLIKRKSFTAVIKNIPTSYAGDRNAAVRFFQDIPHPELYRKIIEMRDRNSIEVDASGYAIFSNKSVKNICISLPMNKGELLKIKGFGRAEVSVFGEKIISLIKEFCRNNNIDLSQKKINYDKILIEPNSVEVTVRYLREGKNIEQIAEERKLAVSTIESHLSQAIRRNLIQIEEVMQIDEARKISEYFPQDLTDIRLAAIKEAAPPEITYGKLRMVLAWLQKGTSRI